MADLNIGGQAVIEGVMMRGEDRISTAVRLPSGEIKIQTDPYKSLAKRYKLLSLPVLRGAVAFVEMLFIGIKTLNFSAEVAMAAENSGDSSESGKSGSEADDPLKEKKSQSGLWLALWAVFSLGIGIVVFFFLPLAAASLLGVSREAVAFNFVAGGVRLTMFIAYVWAIGLSADFRRIFEYHGAEHKSIYAFEMGDELLPERAITYTRFHPRCGTSFILIVALLAIFLYAVADSIYAIQTGHPPELFTRFGLHFSLLPLVAGISFELLKLSGKTRENPITKFFIAPGLWLQKLTTKEPSLEQLEVAIAALKAALGQTETSTTTSSAAAS